MDKQREKLIELMKNAPLLNVLYGDEEEWKIAAEYLLANGVIVPPCKVGDKMYFDGKYFAGHCKGEIMERTVDIIETTVSNTFRGEIDVQFDFKDFGKTVFLSREDAEKALEERKEK